MNFSIKIILKRSSNQTARLESLRDETASKFQKPTFNVVLPFSSILAAAEIREVIPRG